LKEKGDKMPCCRLGYKCGAFLILVISLLLVFSGMTLVYAATTMEVTPSVSNVAPLDTFAVNITVNSVSNLTGWEFKLFYLNSVLNCTAVTEGPLLSSVGGTFKIFNITNNYNSTHGRVLAACALKGLNVSVNGSGVAATVTFKALFVGFSVLDLADTKLSDEKIPPLPIVHTAIDGMVSVGGAEVHDIVVTSVTTAKDGCKPRPTVPDNMFVKVNVTVLNQGNLPETFTVTLYANFTVVDTLPVTALMPGAQATVDFRWNTAGWSHGNYAIGANATVAGDVNPADNAFTDGVLKVVVPGDISGDEIVDIYDAILLANAYNTGPGHRNWCPNADLKTDDFIDIFDAIILANNFGRHE
jgi:hypothetical protein